MESGHQSTFHSSYKKENITPTPQAYRSRYLGSIVFLSIVLLIGIVSLAISNPLALILLIAWALPFLVVILFMAFFIAFLRTALRY